ncbi:MAG: hypothetical protein CMI63_16350 [Parvularcula sp.]|nr:hypothetical protein [Parvularcula sp.]
MKKLPLGAVSASALLLATAACGDADNTYEAADNETVEQDEERTVYAGEDDEYAYADDAEAADEQVAANEQDDESWGAERYDRSAEAVMSDTTDPDLRTAVNSLTRSRDEIESLANRAFEGADADNDGALSRGEYVELALASARDLDAFITEPVNLMSVNPVDDPATVSAPEENTASADVINDDDDVAAAGDATRTAETAGARQAAMHLDDPLDAEREAEIEASAAQIFQDAAGDDAEVTQEELREAFLARFEEADEDGDDELDASELRTFAALTRGQQQTGQMDTD